MGPCVSPKLRSGMLAESSKVAAVRGSVDLSVVTGCVSATHPSAPSEARATAVIIHSEIKRCVGRWVPV